MKHLVVALAAISILFTSCFKDNLTTDEMLIMEIAESSNKVAIDQDDLPNKVKEDCNQKYFETYIDYASKVPTKGYEIGMGSQEFAYFTIDGRKLEWSENKGKDKKGKGDKDCKAKFVETSLLPQAITDYITTNRPGLIIKGGKYFYKGFYLVGTDTKDILVFDDKGAYQKTLGFFSCDDKDGWDTEIQPQDLPTTVQTYLSTNYPNHNIEAAFRKGGKFFVYVYDGTTKLLVGFDGAGSFVFVK